MAIAKSHQPHHHHVNDHPYDPVDPPGHVHEREVPLDRDFNQHTFTVGADLKVMERDTKRMRGDGPYGFARS